MSEGNEQAGNAAHAGACHPDKMNLQFTSANDVGENLSGVHCVRNKRLMRRQTVHVAAGWDRRRIVSTTHSAAPLWARAAQRPDMSARRAGSSRNVSNSFARALPDNSRSAINVAAPARAKIFAFDV